MSIEEIKLKINPVLKEFGVKSASVFGSVARGEERENSDVDILVEFDQIPGLVKFIRMENELRQALGREVDIVVKGSEKPLIRPFIYKNLVSIV